VEAVVLGIAEIEACDPTTLEPLGGTIDTDALEALFVRARDVSNTRSVSFEYCGFLVTVHGDERITFEPLD